MSWLRIDDGEVLDDRVGDLTDREYRARHALLQYVAREANETGLVDEKRVNRAAFSTLRGIRTVTPAILQRLIALDLVQRVDDLTDEYLTALGITRPEGHGWLRPARWERYNPPKDGTNAERQRRYRDAVRNGVTNTVTDRRHNGPSRAGVPSRPVTVPKEQEQKPLGVQPRTNASDPAIEHPNDHEEESEPFDIQAMTDLVADSFGEP